MIKKNDLEMIAARYNIKVSYTEPGEGGFVLDSTGKLHKNVENVFGYDVGLLSVENIYTFDSTALEAA